MKRNNFRRFLRIIGDSGPRYKQVIFSVDMTSLCPILIILKFIDNRSTLTLPYWWWHKKPFVDNVDQDQTAQNVQSDLRSTLSRFSF